MKNPDLDRPLWSDETMAKKIPAVVMALSMQVNMEPWEWKEYEDRVVIVFTCGKKIIFYREQLLPTMAQYIPTALMSEGSICNDKAAPLRAGRSRTSDQTRSVPQAIPGVSLLLSTSDCSPHRRPCQQIHFAQRRRW